MIRIRDILSLHCTLILSDSDIFNVINRASYTTRTPSPSKRANASTVRWRMEWSIWIWLQIKIEYPLDCDWTG